MVTTDFATTPVLLFYCPPVSLVAVLLVGCIPSCSSFFLPSFFFFFSLHSFPFLTLNENCIYLFICCPSQFFGWARKSLESPDTSPPGSSRVKQKTDISEKRNSLGQNPVLQGWKGAAGPLMDHSNPIVQAWHTTILVENGAT